MSCSAFGVSLESSFSALPSVSFFSFSLAAAAAAAFSIIFLLNSSAAERAGADADADAVGGVAVVAAAGAAGAAGVDEGAGEPPSLDVAVGVADSSFPLLVSVVVGTAATGDACFT